MQKCVTVAVAGYGLRGQVYARFALSNPERMKVVAVAEPIAERREMAVRLHGIAPERCFHTAEEMLQKEKLADIMIIATQDRQHVPMAIPALRRGYDLLLEKPISPVLSDCLTLQALARETGRSVTVCHVLRYTEFFGTIKRLLSEGRIGKLLSMDLLERVEYYHHAHSFVRGNWRNSEETSPMILAKCCHDLDMLSWLADERCMHVSSYGALDFFKEACAPEGAAKRCLDGCAAKPDCPYDAEKIYIEGQVGIRGGNHAWPLTALTQEVTEENLYKALKEGPYGRCVFHCDNDVVDHQVVNMRFESGLTATLTMTAFTSGGGRRLHLMGTHGDIVADMENNLVTVTPFGKPPEVYDIEKIAETLVGHGGGDERLMESFIGKMQEPGRAADSVTSIDQSIQSHVMGLAAELSRVRDGESIVLDAFISGA